MIDTATLKSGIDLVGLIGRDVRLKRVATTQGGEWAGACPFCGGRDRLHVQAAGRWFCRQCSGEHWGDAIAYVQKRDNVDFTEACSRLADGVLSPITMAPWATDAGPPDADWQERARLVIDDCERNLWDAQGDRARAWLAARGLDEATILGWRLGYTLGGDLRGHHLANGIVIPWTVGDTVWKLNVRRPVGDPKYLAVKGGKSGLYGAGRPGDPLPDVMVTEGEFDALLVWQQASDLGDVLSLGSATGRLADRWLPTLLPYRRFWIATHNDKAGHEAAKYWLDLVGERGARLLPPGGAKDLTDAHLAGHDLRGWLAGALG